MEEEKFKHISVGEGLDDDDELIVVGLPISQDQKQDTGSKPEVCPVADTTAIHGNEFKDDPEPQPDPASFQQTQPRTEAANIKKSHDYHETTLEDLESQEAPMTQKIIVIAAIILIIVAILYFVIPK